MRRNGYSILLAAAAVLGIGLGAGGLAGQYQVPKLAHRAPELRTARRGNFFPGFGHISSAQRRARPGWSNRHVQRMARKKRNVKRHRAAARG